MHVRIKALGLSEARWPSPRAVFSNLIGSPGQQDTNWTLEALPQVQCQGPGPLFLLSPGSSFLLRPAGPSRQQEEAAHRPALGKQAPRAEGARDGKKPYSPFTPTPGTLHGLISEEGHGLCTAEGTEEAPDSEFRDSRTRPKALSFPGGFPGWGQKWRSRNNWGDLLQLPLAHTCPWLPSSSYAHTHVHAHTHMPTSTQLCARTHTHTDSGGKVGLLLCGCEIQFMLVLVFINYCITFCANN